MINRLIYKAAVAHRNPSLIRKLNFLKESDTWSLKELNKYQFESSRDFLVFTYNNSPYYKKLFDKIGFNPTTMKDILELLEIPVTNKATLINHANEIQSKAKFKTLRLSESSGTTGQPLSILRSEEWDSGARATMFRGYEWYNVKPWDKNGYLWGYNIDSKQRAKIELLDKLQNRFRLFSYSEQEIIEFCVKLKDATYISGYSSMIYEVAKKINQMGLSGQFPNLKMVKGTSEKIFDSYQDEVRKAFGLKMISEYGSMESGIIAFECPEGGSMHIAMESVIAEVVDDKIVVTNLMSHSFPIIRYELGDYIKLAPSDFKCLCGRQHPVILDVLGRVGKNIRGINEAYPSLTFYYVFKNLALTKNINLNYQAIQNEKGRVILKIEQPDKEYSTDLSIELIKYFKKDVHFDIRWGQKLHTMDGKLKDFITTLE